MEPQVLRHDSASAADSLPFLVDHQVGRIIGLLALVFEQFLVPVPGQVDRALDRAFIGHGIFQDKAVLQVVPVQAGEIFDHVGLLGMRQAAALEPEFGVVTHGIDHEGVSLPPANVVAVVVMFKIRRVRTTIHVDLAPGVGAADIEDEDALQRRNIDDFHAIRGQELAHCAGSLAAGVGFQVMGLASIIKSLRPGLHFHVVEIERRRPFAKIDRHPDADIIAGLAADNDAAVRTPGNRRGCIGGKNRRTQQCQQYQPGQGDIGDFHSFCGMHNGFPVCVYSRLTAGSGAWWK